MTEKILSAVIKPIYKMHASGKPGYVISWSDGTYVSEAANMRDPKIAVFFESRNDARRYLAGSYPDAYPWYGHWVGGKRVSNQVFKITIEG